MIGVEFSKLLTFDTATGARVALFARRKQRLDAVVDEFGSKRAFACLVDVTDGNDCISGVSRAEKHFGSPVWGLINCAGVMHYQRVLDIDTVSWENQFNVNCKGVLNCCAAVLPSLKAYRRGHIVNITSDAGKKVFTGLAVYSATKFFVEAFAQGLRQELAPLGVKVTNVQVICDFIYFSRHAHQHSVFCVALYHLIYGVSLYSTAW
jgi:NADP-dependent 3-hydroxy acid dehydrogenase YdfG